MKTIYIILFLVACCSCNNKQQGKSLQAELTTKPSVITETSIIILGTVQDAGSPHIACKKDCCRELFKNPDKNRKVVSLGVVDPENSTKYLFEATPDMTEQMKMLKELDSTNSKETPDAILLTHAHIGHYTGLMYLGKEAMNAKNVTIFAMPVMKKFLEKNGPWSQLVANQNISIQEMSDRNPVTLSSNLIVIPFKVPHREEYSETIGFSIIGPNKKALFIPDIDKWEKWDENITTEISKVDYAFIDATFYDGEEINNRNISEIPHPFIIESMSLFENLSPKEKNKIYFIHLNHTNPALNPGSMQAKQILENGFNIARIYDVFKL
ncbi:MBL fold metallo-hydrolase [Bacteroidota bacterium]